MLKHLLILLLINNIVPNIYLNKLLTYNSVYDNTNNALKKIKLTAVSNGANAGEPSKTYFKLMEYVKSMSKEINNTYKRQLTEDSSKDINILTGFRDYKEFDFDGIQDIDFFSLQHAQKTVWFIAILNTSQVILYKINNDQLYNVGAYPLINGKQIIVNSYNYGALLIIQNNNGIILILNFDRILDKYYLQPIQNFELNDINHFTVWNGMNRLHLAIASHSNISIFTWFGNYFDLTQIINMGCDKVVPFQSKGFMYLAIIKPTTLIFKYFLKFNKFLVVQRLPGSHDVLPFHLKEGHFMEQFLSLSMESGTIIYKEIHNHFVPFQQIYSTNVLIPITSMKAIVLLTVHQEMIMAYQYQGWEFVKLNIKAYRVTKIQPVIFQGKELMLMQHQTGKWALKEPIWNKKKSSKNLVQEIRFWNENAKKKVLKTMEEVSHPGKPIKILQGHINNLFLYNINNHSSETLKNCSVIYKNLISNFYGQKNALQNKWCANNVTILSLHAKKMSVGCKKECKVTSLNWNDTSWSKQISIVKKQAFQKLIVNEIKNWKCPFLKLPIDEFVIDNSINGMFLNYIQKNALKTSGHQEIIGAHTFSTLNVINASMPLGIATYITHQDVRVNEIKVKELNFTEGNIFLPVNGPPATVTGSIKASKLRVHGIVHLRGKLVGAWSKKLSPAIFISKPMNLSNNFILENVKIEKLKSMDFADHKLGPVKNILKRAVSLKDNVTISLILSNDFLKWSNITLHEEQKWITSNFQNVSSITGRKRMFHNVELIKSSYDRLIIPQMKTKLCATSIIAPEVKNLVLTTGQININNLTVSRLFGKLGERHIVDNTTFLFKSILPEEQYYNNVSAKKVIIPDMKVINMSELESFANFWLEFNIFHSMINATNLTISTLVSPAQFDIPLPKIIRNLALEQNNNQVTNINHIDLSNFMRHAIKIGDMISLQTITFSHGFYTNNAYMTHLPSFLTEQKENFNLQNKTISKSIKVNNTIIPHFLTIPTTGASVNVLIKGSSRLPSELRVRIINNITLIEVLNEVWLITNSTIFYGRNLHLRDIIMNRKATLNNSMGSLNPEMWKNISKHVLSKAKAQDIDVIVSLKNIEVPNIFGTNTSTIISTVISLNDIFNNTLINHENQEVKSKWTMDVLKVLGTLDLWGRANDMDLESDIMRHEAKSNIVIGKKTVPILTAEKLNGYKFDKWSDNVLMQNKKNVVIKGQKKFHSVTFNKINVSGTVMDHTIENVLLKARKQMFLGPQKILGHVDTSQLVINGAVNDVNLTNLMDCQLKKHKSIQTIVSRIDMQNSMNVVGNLTINASYTGVEISAFYKNDTNLTLITNAIQKYSSAIEAIDTAIKRQATYINKLEIIRNAENLSKKIKLTEIGRCRALGISPDCFDPDIMNFAKDRNIDEFVLLKAITLNNNKFIVLVKHDSVSIYLYDSIKNYLHHTKELYIQRIVDAYIEPMLQSLWIILRLISQTLILHYQPWNNMHEYTLPITDVFSVGRLPNSQLLLLLSDGVWILDGLASPKNIIRIPLEEEVKTFVNGLNYYVKCTLNNSTSIMKVRYIGN